MEANGVSGITNHVMKARRPELPLYAMFMQLVLIAVGLKRQDWTDYVCIAWGLGFLVFFLVRHAIVMRAWRRGMKSYDNLRRAGYFES